MTPEQIKFVKHYANKLQLLLDKYDCSRNANIKNDISNEIENVLFNYKMNNAVNFKFGEGSRMKNTVWGKDVSEK